jgi:hypothetical protein
MNTSRETMMELLESKWKLGFVNETENFNGSKGGIWLSGESGETYKDGRELFDYWNEDHDRYTFGVHNKIGNWAEENGWWFEWNDAGTIMLWPSWD